MLRAMTTDTSVYVHFPWCERKCPYCDFASLKLAAEHVPDEAYADAVKRELTLRGPTLEGRRLVSVFFGGGTPSMWSGEALGGVLSAIRGAFDEQSEALEVTAECNPASLDRAKAAAFFEAGVGRLSVGVQATVDERLRYLGRLHDGAGALRALEDAVAEVPRVSADLMFGTPGQTVEGLEREVDQVLGVGVEHVSAYSLTIEQGTQFGELHRLGRLEVASEDRYAELFEAAEAHFAARGLAHYEVSSYSAPGAECRHNLHYWRLGAYLGLGAGAVGCLDEGPGAGRRWRNHPDPARYFAGCGAGRLGAVEESEERLDGQTIVREAFMLGLRAERGVDLERVALRAGIDPLAGRERTVERRLAQGDLARDGARLYVPLDRWLALDGIVTDLF